MATLPSFLHEPVVWVFFGIAAIAVLVGFLQRTRRKRAWIREAAARGFEYYDENGKKRPGDTVASPAEVDLAKSFTFRCLQGGYHVHLLMGRHEGKQVFIADYEEKKFPKDLRTEVQQSSSSMTYRRTVFARRLAKGALPTLMVCRGRDIADRLDWIKEDELVEFPDDPAFAKSFAVTSSDAERAQALLSESVRAYLLESVPEGFHLEMRGRDVAIHYGELIQPAEFLDHLRLLSEIMGLVERS